MRLPSVAGTLAAALALAQPAQAQNVTDPDYLKVGAVLYELSCAACHGVDGTGNGPAAGALRPHPTDLTSLLRDNGGAFPMSEVVMTIDGRQQVQAHGNRDMPVWGAIFLVDFEQFTRDTGRSDDVLAKERVQQLADYLASIQKP